MKSNLFIRINILVLLLFTSCSASRTTKLNSYEKTLVGTWRFEKVTQYQGLFFKKGTVVTEQYLEDLLTFKPDRTVALVNKKTGAVIAEGTWAVESDLITYDDSFGYYRLDLSLTGGPERIGSTLKGINAYIRKGSVVFEDHQEKEVIRFKLTRI